MKQCIFSLVFYVIKALLAYVVKYVERKPIDLTSAIDNMEQIVSLETKLLGHIKRRGATKDDCNSVKEV